MKPIKKTPAAALGKVPVSAVSVLKKPKSRFAINFPIAKDTDLEGSEIVIKADRAHINVRLLVKGEEVSQQAIPVKKVPTPPWPKDEIIKALEQLSFNFRIPK